jgi:hypothetical protein
MMIILKTLVETYLIISLLYWVILTYRTIKRGIINFSIIYFREPFYNDLIFIVIICTCLSLVFSLFWPIPCLAKRPHQGSSPK